MTLSCSAHKYHSAVHLSPLIILTRVQNWFEINDNSWLYKTGDRYSCPVVLFIYLSDSDQCPVDKNHHPEAGQFLPKQGWENKSVYWTIRAANDFCRFMNSKATI